MQYITYLVYIIIFEIFVLDVHHYWIHQGIRLKSTDALVKDIHATWRAGHKHDGVHLASMLGINLSLEDAQKLVDFI